MRFAHKLAVLRAFQSPSFRRIKKISVLAFLFLSGALLALIFGAWTYYVRSNEIAEDVLAAVEHETAILQPRIQQFAVERKLSPLDAARAVLGEPQSTSRMAQTGRFLSVAICEPDGSATLLWRDPDRRGPAQVLCNQQGTSTRRSYQNARHEVLRHNGQVYISTRTPIFTERRPGEREVHTVLLLSDTARKGLEREAINSALFAAIVAFLATLIIYPSILLLTRRIRKLSDNLLHSNLEMTQVLGSAIAQRDSDTYEHNYRVSLYSVRLAEQLNLGTAEMRRLLKGAFLHDIGKIGIPDGILRKPGRLTDDEMRIMREHVPLGLDIICRSSWLADAADVVGCHHERIDGTGYPKGISGEGIPLSARIFAIADVFDALCSERPYKTALPADSAISIMRQESGKHFDRTLFDVFENIALDLHARYANRRADELRTELNIVLSDAFAVRFFSNNLTTWTRNSQS